MAGGRGWIQSRHTCRPDWGAGPLDAMHSPARGAVRVVWARVVWARVVWVRVVWVGCKHMAISRQIQVELKLSTVPQSCFEKTPLCSLRMPPAARACTHCRPDPASWATTVMRVAGGCGPSRPSRRWPHGRVVVQRQRRMGGEGPTTGVGGCSCDPRRQRAAFPDSTVSS